MSFEELYFYFRRNIDVAKELDVRPEICQLIEDNKERIAQACNEDKQWVRLEIPKDSPIHQHISSRDMNNAFQAVTQMHPRFHRVWLAFGLDARGSLQIDLFSKQAMESHVWLRWMK